MSMIDATSALVNPRDSWPAWTDTHRWETNDDGPAPTWDAPSYQPSPFSEAFYRGFTLGLDGENPVEPAEFPANPADGPTNRAFLAGLAAGRYTLERERDAVMERLAADAEIERMAAFDPFDLMNPNEIIECRGIGPAMPYDL